MKAKLFKAVIWLIAVIDFIITVVFGGCLNLLFGIFVYYYRRSARYWRLAWHNAELNRIEKQIEKMKQKIKSE